VINTIKKVIILQP